MTVLLLGACSHYAAQFVSAAAVIGSADEYEIEPWKTYLIFLAILTFTTGANIWGNKILGRWNDAAREFLKIPIVECAHSEIPDLFSLLVLARRNYHIDCPLVHLYEEGRRIRLYRLRK